MPAIFTSTADTRASRTQFDAVNNYYISKQWEINGHVIPAELIASCGSQIIQVRWLLQAHDRHYTHA